MIVWLMVGIAICLLVLGEIRRKERVLNGENTGADTEPMTDSFGRQMVDMDDQVTDEMWRY